ncbi:ABC transporter ATP-binding protein [Afifella pfennigii]|uniref:ABC transporter ATP-binding protein n=1 Tax=Afifella pfennigii TaxID=209897 RepID=UPI000479C365|nr:sn-glycerol-3-phosphate ABC transporter ATP-binding protein UgpC [Afifella pfennigii]
MAGVRLCQVRKHFGRTEVIRGVDLDIADGEFVVFVGPSGCGKSTLLRLIAGLEEVSSGAVLIAGKDVTEAPPKARGIAMVFQSYALYPHMTVYQNMAFGLELSGARNAEIRARVERGAEMLRIGELLERKPRELSGGQRQRVAIGRAIVREPKVFLFDEPLSNLDAALRVQTRVEIARLHAKTGTTAIYVTHDQVEAMTLADRIVLLNEGRIEQVGAPLDLYHRPANLFVAGFIGSPRMNLLPATVATIEAGRPSLRLPGGYEIALPAGPGELEAGASVTLGVRPEHLGLTQGTGGFGGPVELVEELGESHNVYVRLARDHLMTVRGEGAASSRVGERVRIDLPPGAVHLFDAAGKALRRAAPAG